MVSIYIAVVVLSYVLGSIPWGYVLMKVFRGEDIRLSGSGNIGATNVARSGAKGLGVLTLVLDALKGLLAVWFASLLAASKYNSCPDANPCVPAMRLMALAGLLAVIGHMAPVWLRFRGGKGVATAVGAFLLLFPRALGVSLVLFVLVVVVTRYVSLGSILAAAVFPFAVHYVDHAQWRTLTLIAVTCALVILKHHANIGRLIAGNENRFGSTGGSTSENES